MVSVASFVGAGTVNATVNTGRLYIKLKPRDQRKRERAARSSTGCAKTTRNVEGISLFMQAVQDVQIDSRVSRTQYQYTLQDADEAELAEWAPKLLAQTRAHCRNWPTWPATSRPTACSSTSTSIARRPRASTSCTQAIDDTLYDAFGQRQVSIIFTQLNQYPRHPRSRTALPAHSRRRSTRFT